MVLSVFALLNVSNISAQIVGGVPAGTPSTRKEHKPIIFLKYGAAIPISNFKICPYLGNTAPTTWEEMSVSKGTIGAKTGFYIEGGVDLGLFFSEEELLGFYYVPIALAYWKTSLDWSELGGFFKDESIYTKSFKMIDGGQRYGLMINPAENLSIGIYYRPGFISPLEFEVMHYDSIANEDFLFTGSASVSDAAPALMMSHTLGISVRYFVIALSAELYSARPTFDITYKDIETNPVKNINTIYTGKIPVKLLNLSLSVVF